MKSLSFSLKINLGLLFSGLIMAFSGLLIQIKYHMKNHSGIDFDRAVWGFSHSDWSLIHKISAITFFFFVVYHIILHWKWFKSVIAKNLITKNKLVISLSIIFLLVAITGYLPWLIEFSEGNDLLCKVIIEIHDKIALIFFVYLILHVSSRIRWFNTTLNKLKK